MASLALRAVQRCRRLASAPGAAKLVFPKLLMTCSLVIQKNFTIFSQNIHDLFIACSLLIHSFFTIFFTTHSRLVQTFLFSMFHNLFRTCSFEYYFFMTCSQFVTTCSQLVHNLFMTYSRLFHNFFPTNS